LNRSERARERIALTARNAGTLCPVINGPIAIVIDAVAHFRGRVDGPDARHLAVLTLDGAITARSRTALTALRSDPRNVVIDHAVAIIIDGIASFSARIDRADTLQRSTDTLNGPELTRHRIRLPTRNAGSLSAIVDHAVAVVIDPVANLHRRIDIADTHDRAHLALRDAESTRSDVARAARFTRIGRRIVDGPITIVVQTIAGLEDLVFDAEIRSDTHCLAALAFGRARMNRLGTFTIGIAITNGTNGHVRGNIVGRVDLAIAIVIDAVANLDAVVADVALVFATRGIRVIEVPEAIARSSAITRLNLALRIRIRTGRHAIVDAFGRTIDGHALLATLAAIRRAGAKIDVFVFDPITIIVFVVAKIVDVTGLDAVIFANLVVVEIVIILRAFVALANSRQISRIGARIALDGRDVAIQQCGEAIVVARPTTLNAGEIDIWTVVDIAIAIIVDFVANFDATVGFDAPTSATAGGTIEDASAFAANVDVPANAHAAHTARGGRRRTRVVAIFPAISSGFASGKTGNCEPCGPDEGQV